MAAVREFPRTDIHYEAETPTGRFFRWAKDEPKAENVPSGGGFSSSAPGGFNDISATLPRKAGVDYSDLGRLSTIRVVGPGGELLCEARLKEAPRVSGDQMAITPVTEGWVNHLQDDNTAAEIYRDVDLGDWIGPSATRLNELEASSHPPNSGFEVMTDVSTGNTALRLHVDDAWVSPNIPVADAWFDAGPSCKVGRVYTQFSGDTNTGFILNIGAGAADNSASLSTLTGDLYTATTGTIDEAISPAARYCFFQWLYKETGVGTAGVQFQISLRRLAVYGNHGLNRRGTEPEAGFYASDVIANAVSRWAPALSFSTGSEGTLRTTSTVIPHLVFKDKTTPLAILEGANAFEGMLYMVLDNKTFHYCNWGDIGKKWRARVAPSELNETGPSTTRLRNGVIVQFTDVTGTTRTAGPIASGCDFESAYLEDRDTGNPANERGLKMYGSPIDIGISTNYNSAEIPVAVGKLILERLKETDTSGSAKLVGYVEDDRGVTYPASRVRAGDSITFVDSSEPVERRIISASYDDSSLTNTIALDAPPEGVPELLAQLGVSIADLGI